MTAEERLDTETPRGRRMAGGPPPHEATEDAGERQGQDYRFSTRITRDNDG